MHVRPKRKVRPPTRGSLKVQTENSNLWEDPEKIKITCQELDQILAQPPVRIEIQQQLKPRLSAGPAINLSGSSLFQKRVEKQNLEEKISQTKTTTANLTKNLENLKISPRNSKNTSSIIKEKATEMQPAPVKLPSLSNFSPKKLALPTANLGKSSLFQKMQEKNSKL